MAERQHSQKYDGNFVTTYTQGAHVATFVVAAKVK